MGCGHRAACHDNCDIGSLIYTLGPFVFLPPDAISWWCKFLHMTDDTVGDVPVPTDGSGTVLVYAAGVLTGGPTV